MCRGEVIQPRNDAQVSTDATPDSAHAIANCELERNLRMLGTSPANLAVRPDGVAHAVIWIPQITRKVRTHTCQIVVSDCDLSSSTDPAGVTLDPFVDGLNERVRRMTITAPLDLAAGPGGELKGEIPVDELGRLLRVSGGKIVVADEHAPTLAVGAARPGTSPIVWRRRERVAIGAMPLDLPIGTGEQLCGECLVDKLRSQLRVRRREIGLTRYRLPSHGGIVDPTARFRTGERGRPPIGGREGADMTSDGAPAGWYSDPYEPSGTQIRYWDGLSWTEHTSPAVAQVQPEVQQAEPFPEVDGQSDATSVATAAAEIPALPPAKSGLLTSKKAAIEEAERLRAILNAMGFEERAALQEENERLQVAQGALRAAAQGLEGEIVALRAQLVELSDEAVLQEVGIYQFSHPLDSSVEYSDWLKQVRQHCKTLQSGGLAVTATSSWTVNNSQKEGQRMVRDLSKLMLRAYNAEAENCVRTVKPSNRERVVDRLNKTRDTIAKLGSIMSIRISDEFHAARVQEIRVTSDFLAKKEAEKEAERQRRAEEREIERANREFEAERQRMLKERQQYADALRQLQANGDEAAAAEMIERLAEIDQGIEGLTERFANRRAGHVYVISNVGAFGDRMVKIGLTRRLDPMDRVRELGDASVPFRYDVHALFFSDDAVALETELHRRFEPYRVNLVNHHREFFYVTPAQVREALIELDGHLLEFVDDAPAEEFQQSQNERQSRYGSAATG
jgi:hypothetical protein